MVLNTELISILDGVKKDDNQSFAKLVEMYSSLTENAVHRFSPSFGIGEASSENSDNIYDLDDLRQCAAVALYKAAKTYDIEEKGQSVSFGLYAKICINNALITELRKYNRRIRKNDVKNLYSGRASHDHGKSSIVNNDPLLKIVSDYTASEQLGVIRVNLSDYELKVFEEYTAGKSIKEIAESFGKTEKSVSNALYRMKVKIRGLLKN